MILLPGTVTTKSNEHGDKEKISNSSSSNKIPVFQNDQKILYEGDSELDDMRKTKF